jgi:hypothetical protein
MHCSYLADATGPSETSTVIVDDGHGHIVRIPRDHSDVLVPIAVFVFVLFIILINRYFWIKRQQLWHETARLALEKGQPIPDFGGRWRRGPGGWGCGRSGWMWYRGLVWIAAGVGLYLSNLGHIRSWAPIPICIGVAMVVGGLIAGNRRAGEDPNNKDDPSART